jgi:hypothetical protein
MRISGTLVGAVALLLTAQMCLASDGERCAAEPSASDVQFTLSLQGGRTVFREGEMISLSLGLSTESSRYWVNTASYDRSGRLESEAYCVDPDGDDPLANYFNQPASIIGGGLFSEIQLSKKPFTRESDLNEWSRLTPGHHRLYVVSSRVFRPGEPGEKSETGNIPITLRSNTVEFEVKPADESWEKEQVRAAVAELDSSPPKAEDAKHAARVLRFLGTRDSTVALAKVYTGETQKPGQFDMMLGLFSSPFPDIAIKAMRAEFAAPEHAMDAMYLDTLVELQIASDPAWSITEGGASPSDLWKRRQEHYKELMRTEVADLASVVSRKSGPARAITLNGMLREVSDDPPLVQAIRPALIASWKDLPSNTQQQMITYFWQALDGPEMLPVLRSILAGPSPPARTMSSEMRNAALRHIYEFNPAEGRTLIARDLANPGAEPTLENIRLLDSEQIQAALPAAVERIRKNSPRMVDFELVDLYGNASLLASVQAIVEREAGNQACDPQAHLLRYLLRVAPEYGAQEVRVAMAARKETGCYRMLLQELGDQLPHAQQAAVEALDDADSDVERSAAEALGRWGTADAEGALWSRMERFHDEWSGRAGDLRRTPDYESEGSRAISFEPSLAQAIALGSGWICPPEKLARLSRLVLTDYHRGQVKNWMEQWKAGTFQISSGWSPADAPTFSMIGYADLSEDQLRAKLAQFPRGTRFAWLIWMPGQIQPPVSVSNQEAVFERVRADAESHGMVVVRQGSGQ